MIISDSGDTTQNAAPVATPWSVFSIPAALTQTELLRRDVVSHSGDGLQRVPGTLPGAEMGWTLSAGGVLQSLLCGRCALAELSGEGTAGRGQ